MPHNDANLQLIYLFINFYFYSQLTQSINQVFNIFAQYTADIKTNTGDRKKKKEISDKTIRPGQNAHLG